MNLPFNVRVKPTGVGAPRSAPSRVAYSSLPTSTVGVLTLVSATSTGETSLSFPSLTGGPSTN